jgi:hypothetical protein
MSGWAVPSAEGVTVNESIRCPFLTPPPLLSILCVCPGLFAASVCLCVCAAARCVSILDVQVFGVLAYMPTFRDSSVARFTLLGRKLVKGLNV